MTPPIVPPVHSGDRIICAQDGFELAATLFQPEQGSCHGVVVISSGTGIPRQFYRHLATYLAQQGYLTISYDYRGIGQSRPQRLQGFAADLTSWGQLDMTAVLAHARSLGGPVYWVGHSAGAQMIGLAQGAEGLQGVVSIASGAGYWRQMQGPYRWFCAAMWYGFVPLSTRLLGYVPANAIGQGQDLPAGVALEWARWCRSAGYFGDHLKAEQKQRMAQLKVPWLSLSFSDDPLADPAAVEQLLEFYQQAQICRRTIHPRDIGQVEIGHHGFFRPQRCGLLWPQLVEFFESIPHRALGDLISAQPG